MMLIYRSTKNFILRSSKVGTTANLPKAVDSDPQSSRTDSMQPGKLVDKCKATQEEPK